MLQPDTWKTIALVVGSVVGVFIGAYLTRSWDRNKWLNDNRKQEYRELLAALTKASVAVINSAPGHGGNMKAECTEFHRVIDDRIFIAAELEEIELASKWDEAAEKVSNAMKAPWSKGHDLDLPTPPNTADEVAVFKLEVATLRKSVVSKAVTVSPMWSGGRAFLNTIQKMADNS